MQLPEHEYKDLEREHFEICHYSTVCILLSEPTVEKELLQERIRSSLYFFYYFVADALHHTLGICSRQRNIARKNKGVVF